MSEPLIIAESRLFAPIRLGTAMGYACLDTGLAQSGVFRARAAGYPRLRRREVTGGRASGTSQVSLDEVGFLGETLRGVMAAVMPEGTYEIDGAPGDLLMVLGADVLLRKPLYLDLVAGQITYLDAPPRGNGWRCVPALFEQPMPVVGVQIGGRQIDAAFDTGAGISVLDQTMLGLVLDHVVQDEPVAAEDVAGNSLLLPTFICQGLSLDGLALTGCRALGIDISTLARAANLKVRFMLGVNAMAGRRWVLDAPGQALYVDGAGS